MPGAPTASPDDVLLIGDPRLRRTSAPVTDLDAPAFRRAEGRLHATLAAFRDANGFGRAVSAPQIGVDRRFIATNLGHEPFTIVNPEITHRSADTFTMWDDCMSFPFLLVKVRRHASISLVFEDERGKRAEWNDLDAAISELLQHEIDHLDGVLAVDRAIDRDSIVSRSVFESDPEHFAAQVDYVIG